LSSSDFSEFVLDASAFYAGIPFQSSKKCFTTNAVYNEVKHIRRSYSPLEALIDAGNLIVIEPEKTSLDKVIATAKETGDTCSCSSTEEDSNFGRLCCGKCRNVPENPSQNTRLQGH